MFGLVSKKEFNKLKEDHKRLERIFRYSKDGEPTFNLRVYFSTDCENHRCYTDYILYLYIDRYEYVFKPDELQNTISGWIHPDTAHLEMDDDTGLAIFSIECRDNRSHRLVFLIDYITGKYVCKHEEIESKITEEDRAKFQEDISIGTRLGNMKKDMKKSVDSFGTALKAAADALDMYAGSVNTVSEKEEK